MLALLAAPAAPAVAPAPATWTNEEEVYFARDAGKAPPPWLGLREEAGRLVAVDAFGLPVAAQAQGGASVTEITGGLMRVTWPDGTISALRRGRQTTCWVAVRRDRPTADGKEDWTFQSSLAIHDQGGRAHVGGKGAPAALIRMRHVVWPAGNGNRPSLVLYIHMPDAPDHAVSYAWADPGAARVGINLRWIQASCTIDGRDTPATVSQGADR